VVGRAFDSLPPRWRAVLWQTEVEGRSPASLAAVSGMSANGVAQLASRARMGLAVAWERERGGQMRDTAPLPALRRLAARRHSRR
jgi:DNA-directed RNA polymerase specialized sigma24 family protein